jgi:hypothetical protein
MNSYVSLTNPASGETRVIKVGWSWTLLFFSSFFGFPLFIRKLDSFGFVMISTWLLTLQTCSIPDQAMQLAFNMLIFLGSGGLSIWLACHGNRMTALALIDRGWKFSDPDSPLAKLARRRWSLSEAARPGSQ